MPQVSEEIGKAGELESRGAMRRCTKCAETKPEEAFYKGQSRPCKACERVARRARTLRENPNAGEYCLGTLEERFAYYFDATVTEPFDPRIAVAGCPNTPCRVGWKSGRDTNGYPNMKGEKGKTVSVHRWLYELHHGPIPVGWYVRHLCNRKCLSIEHLKAGTSAENHADQIAAGTTKRGLSVEQVRTILRLTAEGKSQREIAREIGCIRATVREILNGIAYKEVSRVIEPAGHQFNAF